MFNNLISGDSVMKKIVTLTLAILMVVSLAIPSSVIAKSLLDEIKDRGKIKIGSIINEK